MNRRTFLGVAAANAVAQTSSIPIIDAHIHLFDTTRPEGVPFPNKNNPILFKPALPPRYRNVVKPFGVSGAIVVECSPLLEDNQWLLDTAATDKIIVGVVGNLEPGTPDFLKNLERFHRNPLYLGFRTGNLWGRSLLNSVSKPEFVSGLKALAQTGLELDTANPEPSLVAGVVRLTDQVPDLRVVVDHMTKWEPLDDPPVLAEYRANMRELAKRPNVYVKVSEVLRRVDGKVPVDVNFYRQQLDEVWDIFGQNRLIYGSDWPNSDQLSEYPEVFGLVRNYVTAKGPAVAEKFFWKNSVAAYRWKRRDPGQPDPSAA